jgi:hypothetical protein
MRDLVLPVATLYNIKEADLVAQLIVAMADGSTVQVILPTPCLEQARWNSDIASEYYEALIVGENIAPFCTHIEWDPVPGVCGTSHIRFTLSPHDPVGLGHKLAWYAQGRRLLNYPEDTSWKPEHQSAGDIEELRGTFNQDLESNVTRFSDLAENYVRNLEVGISQEYEGEQLRALYDELRVAYKRWWDPSLEDLH